MTLKTVRLKTVRLKAMRPIVSEAPIIRPLPVRSVAPVAALDAGKVSVEQPHEPPACNRAHSHRRSDLRTLKRGVLAILVLLVLGVCYLAQEILVFWFLSSSRCCFRCCCRRGDMA